MGGFYSISTSNEKVPELGEHWNSLVEYIIDID